MVFDYSEDYLVGDMPIWDHKKPLYVFVSHKVKNAGCNGVVVYLGNFGPEISESLIAKHFDGPVMYIAAAED